MSAKVPEERLYESFQQDFVTSPNQDYTLPPDYVWVRRGMWAKVARAVLYGISCAFARIYAAIVLHLRVVRCPDWEKFRDTGAVVYGNHTQPVGDVFMPALTLAPKRCYTVASPANLGMPVLGNLLPWMGALPIPGTLRGMKEFLDAVRVRLKEGSCVVVYPEAHVWPYYTGIRPFPAVSFAFAAENRVPAFAMTTTYQPRKHGGRPRTTVYLDGPFYPEEGLSPREQKNQLRDAVYACMKERSKLSTCAYIVYRPKEADTK